jgi:hypothetical protein
MLRAESAPGSAGRWRVLQEGTSGLHGDRVLDPQPRTRRPCQRRQSCGVCGSGRQSGQWVGWGLPLAGMLGRKRWNVNRLQISLLQLGVPFFRMGMSGRHLSQRDKALVADPWLVAWTAYARARPRRANASSSFRTIRVVEKLPETRPRLDCLGARADTLDLARTRDSKRILPSLKSVPVRPVITLFRSVRLLCSSHGVRYLICN